MELLIFWNTLIFITETDDEHVEDATVDRLDVSAAAAEEGEEEKAGCGLEKLTSTNPKS